MSNHITFLYRKEIDGFNKPNNRIQKERIVHRKRLFIIGNGFDIACGLSTCYSDFCTYIKDKKETKMLTEIINYYEKKKCKGEIAQGSPKKWSGLKEYCGSIEQSVLEEFIGYKRKESYNKNGEFVELLVEFVF